ncbi:MULTISPECIES: autotransporter domain-containing protein [unclassified Halomonas]|uniref:autotransporter domain-containing protein n=1 Tax=unclassified Halomonas TaxID=2609666 RepID=UPI0020A21026|nr:MULTISPECIES: autotransporter domain-containing protein [unclassified Halomonas]MCP1314605.1 autotransporter domain-containing protein [Halomonas sp. 707D7]MCP1326871.1 autotransporter domain-containing protein [Halomonas sp. 707D4]
MPTLRYRRLALSILVAVGALPLSALAATMFDEPFNDTVFFGDSLTDSGYYREPIARLLSLPPGQRDFVGRFTVNPGPVWAERVADRFGGSADPSSAGGSNYAAGGARVTAPSSVLFGAAPPLSEQIASYLQATGGVADGDTLYAVWAGANDLFAVSAGGDAASIIRDAAVGTAQAAAALENAGAQHVLLFNIPDFGLTPRFNGDPATRAGATALAGQYNETLYAAVAASGVDVIPVDTFSLLQEVAADPGRYGFTNITDSACTQALPLCNPGTLVAPEAGERYMFADEVHPTPATHRIIGEVVVSMLEAPQLQQLVTHSAVLTGRTRANRVAEHLNAIPLDNGLRWWGDLRAERQKLGSSDLYDANKPSGLLGVDWYQNGWVMGGFAGYGDQDADVGGGRGSFQRQDTTLGLFTGWYTDSAWANAQLSYTWLDVDIDRDIQLGSATRRHSGSTQGKNLTAALNAGVDVSAFSIAGSDVKTGPIAGLTWQRVELDGFDETARSSTALTYPDRNVDSLVGRLGWQIRRDGPTFNPYLQVSYNHEFEQNDGASATLQTLPQLGDYRVPRLDLDRDYVELDLGARATLGGIDAQIGANVDVDDARSSALFLSLGKRF